MLRLTSVLSTGFVVKDQLATGLNVRQSICTRRNRAFAHPSGRTAFPQAPGLLSQLPISSEIMAASASRGGQDRVARRRVVPACRIHRDQLEQALEERREVLQRSRHRRAVDQGRQERRQMDEALLPHVQRQPSSVATVRVGLQPGQLLAAAGLAETGAALVVDNAAGKADQDWGQGDAALEVRHVPTGRGGGDTELIRRDP